MTDPKIELEELRALREEGAEKRARRKRARQVRKPSPEPTAAAPEEGGAPEPAAEEPTAEGQAPEWMETLEDLAAHLDSAVTDIEEATREHPALALLAAFSIGVFFGRLFSRR